MRQVYLREIIRTEPATPTYYTYDRPVDPGNVLVLTNLSVFWDAMATTENGKFFIDAGGQRIFLGDDVPGRIGGGAYWQGKVAIGEHCRVGVYTADSANGDVLAFGIAGELWTRDAWNKKIVSLPTQE